jgi:hypothetical protein
MEYGFRCSINTYVVGLQYIFQVALETRGTSNWDHRAGGLFTSSLLNSGGVCVGE